MITAPAFNKIIPENNKENNKASTLVVGIGDGGSLNNINQAAYKRQGGRL